MSQYLNQRDRKIMLKIDPPNDKIIPLANNTHIYHASDSILPTFTSYSITPVIRTITPKLIIPKAR